MPDLTRHPHPLRMLERLLRSSGGTERLITMPGRPCIRNPAMQPQAAAADLST